MWDVDVGVRMGCMNVGVEDNVVNEERKWVEAKGEDRCRMKRREEGSQM